MADGWLKSPLSLAGKKIWIAGHGGMVGSALVRALAGENCQILKAPRDQLDLRDAKAVDAWLAESQPEIIVLAAAKVGGIGANAAAPADFLYDNLMIAANVIHGAHRAGVGRLLFLGSSCMYPHEAAQPMTEEMLLTGLPEPTNAAYALAKLAGMKLCEAYRAQHGRDYMTAIPCNLYGPGDRYDAQASHVIPALIMKAHAAKESGAQTLSAWGSGRPLREFLHVDDLAEALVFMLKNYSGAAPVNIGSGEEISIADLAQAVCAAMGFEGGVEFDVSKPDGVARKIMDSSGIRAAGWVPRTRLEPGLKAAYADYLKGEIHKKAA